MKNDFIPATMAELDTWEVNFKEKIGAISTTLNIDTADVAATLTRVDAHRNSYASMVGTRAAAKASTSTNATSERDAVLATRQLTARIKAAKGYTESMGNDLKIIGTDTSVDKTLLKPMLTASIEGALVVLKFNKNRTSGVHIYCRRATEKEFTFLAVDTASPYHDNRTNLVAGQSEKREYKAWYFEDEAIIGQEGDVVSISI